MGSPLSHVLSNQRTNPSTLPRTVGGFMETLTVITEPLLDPHFVQFEVTVPILERLTGRYEIQVAAPRITRRVQAELERRGIQAVDGGAFFPPLRRPRDEIPSYVGSWARDALWAWNRRDLERALGRGGGLRVNISMTTAIDADVWFIQSRPLGYVLDSMRRGMKGMMGNALGLVQPIVEPLDLAHLQAAGHRARLRYASTQHVADWFAAHGLPVREVIPMYYRPVFSRGTSNPSRDYLLTYLGKETDVEALSALLRTGIPVRMFGSKSAGWVLRKLRLDRFPNARFLGHVTDLELRELYSNALFTAFPFTEEPFGLIPLESMACGTPVLTYDFQGPAETVVEGRTGWRTANPLDFVQRAQRLWREGVPAAMTQDCLRRAQRYHLDTVTADWRRLLSAAEAGVAPPIQRPASRGHRFPLQLPRLVKPFRFPQPPMGLSSSGGGLLPGVVGAPASSGRPPGPPRPGLSSFARSGASRQAVPRSLGLEPPLGVDPFGAPDPDRSPALPRATGSPVVPPEEPPRPIPRATNIPP